MVLRKSLPIRDLLQLPGDIEAGKRGNRCSTPDPHSGIQARHDLALRPRVAIAALLALQLAGIKPTSAMAARTVARIAAAVARATTRSSGLAHA
jgi:hypothetical protein